jgi:hypothetical protein
MDCGTLAWRQRARLKQPEQAEVLVPEATVRRQVAGLAQAAEQEPVAVVRP